MRRLEAARLLREVPLVAEKVKSGDLNLSQIGELSRAVKEKQKELGQELELDQKTELVEKISGKTVRQTQRELSLALDLKLSEPEVHRVQKDESVHLEMTLSREQYEKLQRCRGLLSHQLQQRQDVSTRGVLELLMDKLLKESGAMDFTPTLAPTSTPTPPAVGEVSAERSSISVSVAGSVKKEGSISASKTERVNKSVTPKTRRILLQKDKCCRYRDPMTGRRCESAFGLEIDHRTSQWAGGTHELSNLQVLCRKHNRFKYRQESGIGLR